MFKKIKIKYIVLLYYIGRSVKCFSVCLERNSIGFRVVMLACDQLVKQHVVWEKILACMKRLAASIARYGLICVRLARLSLMLLAIFSTCFLNDRF